MHMVMSFSSNRAHSSSLPGNSDSQFLAYGSNGIPTAAAAEAKPPDNSAVRVGLAIILEMVATSQSLGKKLLMSWTSLATFHIFLTL